jgi:hypothetical protein
MAGAEVWVRAWVIGNALWVAYGIVTGNPYVVVMFAFYWVTAVVGLFNVHSG